MSANVLSPQSSPSIFEAHAGDARRRDHADAMHSRLVAYVHALAEGREARTGVWMEHSYARARGAAAGGVTEGGGVGNRDVRVLLAPRTLAPTGDVVDVETPDPSPPEPPDAPCDVDRDDSDVVDHTDVDDDWEARVSALAPTPAHARLADAAFVILRQLRLARLTGRGAVRREDVRAAARRLRLAMAGGWAAPGAAQQRPPAWLHAALHAYLPRELRALYEDVSTELRRAMPKLAERLLAGRAPPPPQSPEGVGPEGAAEAGPLLAWLRTGRDRLEERWERRLRRVLYTRPLDVRAAAGVSAGASPPEQWCAAAVGAARAALADMVALAEGREVIVGGVGAGAAVCAAALCGSGTGGVVGALLLAPALVTAEGSRDTPDDPLGEIRVPVLVVVGSGAGNAWRGAARAVTRARLRGAPRRLVEVRGADHLLRLGHATRRRLALTQRALDAAVAEECARWAAEVADAAEGDDAAAEWRAVARPVEEEEYSHLPVTAPSHTRAIEIVEGRVVSRVSGGTPLALAPPRRPASASSTPPPPALAAADIMQLPIVFADDERAAGPGVGAGRRARADADAADAMTVTSGEARADRRVKYARVIVAKRGGGGGAGAGAGAAPSPLPVVVRRGVRVAAPRD